MSRVDELRAELGRPSSLTPTMERFETVSDVDPRDPSPARSDRQLLQGVADGGDAAAAGADPTAPVRPRASRAMRSTSRSGEPDPNLVEFGVRDPDNPLHFSTLKKLRIFIVRARPIANRLIAADHAAAPARRCLAWDDLRSGSAIGRSGVRRRQSRQSLTAGRLPARLLRRSSHPRTDVRRQALLTFGRRRPRRTMGASPCTSFV